MKRGLPVLLVSAVFVSSAGAVDVEHPFIQSFAHFPYVRSSVLPSGRWAGTIQLSYSNIWTAMSPKVSMADMEMGSLTLGVQYGLFRNVTAEAYLRGFRLQGGIFDGLIESFHNTLGIWNFNRETYPRNAVRYYLKPYFSYGKAMSVISAPVVGLLARLYSSPSLALHGRLSVGIPAAPKRGLSAEKPFVTSGLILGFSVRKMTFEISNYLSFFSSPDYLQAEDLKKYIFSSGLTVRWRFLSGVLLLKSSPLRTTSWRSHAYSIQMAAAVSRRVEIGFTEDFPPWQTTPDIGIFVKWAWKDADQLPKR
jgi:hypothetical protein